MSELFHEVKLNITYPTRLNSGEVTTLGKLAKEKRIAIHTAKSASRRAKKGFTLIYTAVLVATGETWVISKTTYERLQYRLTGRRPAVEKADVPRYLIQFTPEELEYIRECISIELGKYDTKALAIAKKIDRQLKRVRMHAEYVKKDKEV